MKRSKNLQIDRSIPYLMSRVAGLLNQQFHEYLSKRNLTFQHWRVLATLDALGESTIAEISAFAVVPHSTLSRLLDRMEQEDLVRRRSSAEDARTARIDMTSRGRKALKAIWPRAVQIRQKALSNFAVGEEERLRSLLKKMQAALAR